MHPRYMVNMPCNLEIRQGAVQGLLRSSGEPSLPHHGWSIAVAALRPTLSARSTIKYSW